MKKIILSLSLLIILTISCDPKTTKPITPPIPTPISDINTPVIVSRFDLTFQTSTFDGWNTKEEACEQSGNSIPVYSNGNYTNIHNLYLDGKKLYKDSSLTEVFFSDEKWFKINDNSFKISLDGSLTNMSKCE